MVHAGVFIVVSIALPVRLSYNFSRQRNFTNFFDVPSLLGDFQDEDADVSEVEFRCLPGFVAASVPEFQGIRRGGFVLAVGDPGADGLSGGMDGLKNLIRPSPLGGISLRAPAAPASKTPPIPPRFSMSNGGSGTF